MTDGLSDRLDRLESAALAVSRRYSDAVPDSADGLDDVVRRSPTGEQR